MPSINISMQRIDSSLNPNALLPKTVASIVYRDSGVSVEDELTNKLPEPRSSVPTSLTEGKIISVNGVIYVGNSSNVPTKINYTHPTTAGNKHLPPGGNIGQMLINSALGTGEWQDVPTASTSGAGIVQLNSATNSSSTTQAATPSAVKAAYDLANHTHPYINTNQIGVAGGVVPLGSDKKIEAQYLPSYVDDVLEGTVSSDLKSFTLTGESTACTPETGKIYSDTSTNKSYRWSGTQYVRMDDGVALGETSTTAYRGDRGKIAYDHSQSDHARVDATLVEKSSTNGNIKINSVETTVYTHPTTAGNKHLPSGGTVGQYLKNSASGTGTWANIATSVDANTEDPVAGKVLYTAQTSLQTQIDGKASSDHNHDSRYYTETEVDTLLKNKSDTGHTHSESTQESAGFMSADDKQKLDSIAFGANQISIDSVLSSSSTNPVQNKVITNALSGKSDKGHTHTSAPKLDTARTIALSGDVTGSTSFDGSANVTIATTIESVPAHDHDNATSSSDGYMSSSDKNKLDNIEAGANKTVVDSALSTTSTNPVQNKIVTAALDEKANSSDVDSAIATKQDTITGAATTIVSSNLSTNRALISSSSGKVAASTVTATELGYLSGVTSAVQSQLNAKAPTASPTFTGTPKAPTASEGTNTTQIATTAFVHTAVEALLGAKDALVFKGAIAGTSTLPTADAGHVYRVSSDGTINGLIVHEGDTLTCCVDGTPAGTADNWFVTHTNHDGEVMGPSSAVDSHVAAFDGTTGTLIKDSGYTIASNVPADAKFTDTVYTHPTTSGYKHIPAAGSTGQLLWNSAAGTASWVSADTSPTSGSTKPITSGAVYTMQTELQSDIDGKASSDHNHDSRYYTETEVDTLLKNKSDTGHTHSEATTTTAGFMSAADKQKLDTVSANANQVTVDSELSTTSTNPVQNKIITAELSTKATTETVNKKQDTITGAATTVTSANLTASRALVSDSSGKIGISAVTSTELGYLSGVTSAVQTQLNARAPLASPTLTGTPKAPTATAGTNTTQIATTAFVQTAVGNIPDATTSTKGVVTVGDGLSVSSGKISISSVDGGTF